MSPSQQWQQDSSVVDITCEKGLRNFAFKLLKFQPGLACGQCNSKLKQLHTSVPSYVLLPNPAQWNLRHCKRPESSHRQLQKYRLRCPGQHISSKFYLRNLRYSLTEQNKLKYIDGLVSALAMQSW